MFFLKECWKGRHSWSGYLREQEKERSSKATYFMYFQFCCKENREVVWLTTGSQVLIICVCMYAFMHAYMYVYLSTTCVPSTQECQKRPSDPLELELQMDLSCHVAAGSRTQVLYKSSHCLT